MKRSLLLIILFLIVGIMNASIFGQGTEILNEINGFILALGVVIGTAIGVRIQIQQQFKQDEVKTDLVQQTTGLIAEAKENPIALLSTIVNKPDVNLVEKPKESKNMIVSAALLEREPHKAKKLKITDLISAGQFVSSVYSTVKPLIKKL